eukprot:591248-Lingulodinium_polyedra.AAC.1
MIGNAVSVDIVDTLLAMLRRLCPGALGTPRPLIDRSEARWGLCPAWACQASVVVPHASADLLLLT